MTYFSLKPNLATGPIVFDEIAIDYSNNTIYPGHIDCIVGIDVVINIGIDIGFKVIDNNVVGRCETPHIALPGLTDTTFFINPPVVSSSKIKTPRVPMIDIDLLLVFF